MPNPKNSKKIKNGLKKITSLNDLRWKCSEKDNPESYDKYRQLAIISSDNLGGPAKPTLEQALRWLDITVMETDPEGGSDRGVVDEVNFCLDLVE